MERERERRKPLQFDNLEAFALISLKTILIHFSFLEQSIAQSPTHTQ